MPMWTHLKILIIYTAEKQNYDVARLGGSVVS